MGKSCEMALLISASEGLIAINSRWLVGFDMAVRPSLLGEVMYTELDVETWRTAQDLVSVHRWRNSEVDFVVLSDVGDDDLSESFAGALEDVRMLRSSGGSSSRR